MAKSNGRTSRPQRTSRNSAKAEQTTDEALVVEETDVESAATAEKTDEVEASTGEATVSESTAAASSPTKDGAEPDGDSADSTDGADSTDKGASAAKSARKKTSAKSAPEDAAEADGTDADDTTADSGKKGRTGRAGRAAAKKDAKSSPGKRTTRSGNPAKRSQGRKKARYTSEAGQQTIKPNPRWFLPVLLGLLLVGLVWLVVFYITQGAFPVEAWGNWNILIGFAFFVAGLIMSTRWR